MSTQPATCRPRTLPDHTEYAIFRLPKQVDAILQLPMKELLVCGQPINRFFKKRTACSIVLWHTFYSSPNLKIMLSKEGFQASPPTKVSILVSYRGHNSLQMPVFQRYSLQQLQTSAWTGFPSRLPDARVEQGRILQECVCKEGRKQAWHTGCPTRSQELMDRFVDHRIPTPTWQGASYSLRAEDGNNAQCILPRYVKLWI